MASIQDAYTSPLSTETPVTDFASLNEQAFTEFLASRQSLEFADNNTGFSKESVDASKIAATFKLLTQEAKTKQEALQLEEANLEKAKQCDIAITQQFYSLKAFLQQTEDCGDLSSFFTAFNQTLTHVQENWTKKRKDTIDRIQQDLTKLNCELNNLRDLILVGTREIVTPEKAEKKLCPICFDREVDTAYAPCGHTFCKQCSLSNTASHYQMKRCTVCRSEIKSTIKLFFSV